MPMSKTKTILLVISSWRVGFIWKFLYFRLLSMSLLIPESFLGVFKLLQRSHSFSTFAKFSEKLIFLTPRYAHVCTTDTYNEKSSCTDFFSDRGMGQWGRSENYSEKIIHIKLQLNKNPTPFVTNSNAWMLIHVVF